MNSIPTKRKGSKKRLNNEQQDQASNNISNLCDLPEGDVMPQKSNKRPKKDPWDEKEWRIMIAGYFRQTLNMPSKSKWGGHAGTISQICRVFNLPEGANERVKRVLEYSVSYEARGQVYKGERLNGQGLKPIISSPYEYQIVIGVVEKGKGAAMALLLLNKYRSTEGRDPVGISAVRNTVKRLRPVIRSVRKRKQGNKDKNSPWAKARLGWVTQILVRMQKHVFIPEEDCNKFLELTATPEYFDAAKLPKLSLFQIAF
jgi:hypothetical protein